MSKILFYPVATDYRAIAEHQRLGGRDLRRHAADIHDGQLRVMSALAPFGTRGLHQRHVSISVGAFGRVGVLRAATDEECQSVLDGLFPLVNFVERNAPEIGPLIRNWREVERN